jgi:hypothetical protein
MPDTPSLAGPLARIDRADELVKQLDTTLKAFVATKPYTAEQQPDDNPTNRRYVVTRIQEVPLAVRVLVGEISHHLRASLDLLAYQLLLKEGVTDEKQLRDCSFPIIVNRDLTKPEDKRKHDDAIKKAIGGASPRALTRIVTLQPCGSNREWSHLAQIQALDNTDKHRVLLAAFGSSKLKDFTFHDGTRTEVFPEAWVPLQEGAMLILSNVPVDMVIAPNFINDVTFNEPGPVFGKPIVPILKNLSQMTHMTVNAFHDCF